MEKANTTMEKTNTMRMFEGLAQRMRRENDLSDMVYALSLCNPHFKQYFLDFFFPDGGLKAETASIEREVEYPDGSRPDFAIRADEDVFFVEVKIWDRSHHFSQYATTLGTLHQEIWHLGYIANYKIVKADLPEADRAVFETLEARGGVKIWRDFLRGLESHENAEWACSEEVRGFAAYCKRVCPDIGDEEVGDVYAYDFNDFESSKAFYGRLKGFLESKPTLRAAGREILLGKHRASNVAAETIGFYFVAEDAAKDASGGAKAFGGKKVFGWVGFRLKGSDTGFCIAFDNLENWGKPVFDARKGDPAWADSPAWKVFRFGPPTGDFEKSFFENAFCAVFGHVIAGTRVSEWAETGGAITATPYYRALRNWPLFLRQRVFPRLRLDGCRISPFTQGDAFNPLGYCGEYFSVAKEAEGGDGEREIGRFWVGVYFDGRKDQGITCERIVGRARRLSFDGSVTADALCSEVKDEVATALAMSPRDVAPRSAPAHLGVRSALLRCDFGIMRADSARRLFCDAATERIEKKQRGWEAA